MAHGWKKLARARRAFFSGIVLPMILLSSALAHSQATRPAQPPKASLEDILRYISGDWDKLTRSTDRCGSVADPKIDGKPVVYLPMGMTIPATLVELRKHCAVDIEHLPAKITSPGGIDTHRIPREGLLYLEHPYVVPGGQFNEMYGWDSYFIIRGLLRDNRIELAKGMVENFFYEIEHYGGVLNANRTYYLGRSQPPFLTSMILAVYQSDQSAGKANLPW